MRFSTVLLAVVYAATFGSAQSLSGGDATVRSAGLGTCGQVYTDSDFVVAIDKTTMDEFAGNETNPELNPLCGRHVVITTDIKAVGVVIQDTCDTCSVGSVELTRAAFEALAIHPVTVDVIHDIKWTVLA